MLQNKKLFVAFIFILIFLNVPRSASETALKPSQFSFFPSAGTVLPPGNDFAILNAQIEAQFKNTPFVSYKSILMLLPEDVKKKNLAPSHKVLIPAVKKIDVKCKILTCFSVDNVEFSKVSEESRDIPLPITQYTLVLKYSVSFYDIKCSKLIDSASYKEKEKGSVLSEKENAAELNRLKTRLLVFAAKKASTRIFKLCKDLVQEPSLMVIKKVSDEEIFAQIIAGDAPKSGMTYSIVVKINPKNPNDTTDEIEYTDKGQAIVLSVKSKVVRLKLLTGVAKTGYYLRK